MLDSYHIDLAEAEGSLTKVYTGAVVEAQRRAALEGLVLSETEKTRILDLAKTFGLNDETVRTAFQQQALTVFSDHFGDAVSDKRLSEQEEMHLLQLLEQFGPSAKLDDSTLEAWAYFKNPWEYSRGQIPAVDVEINLQRGEWVKFQSQP